MGRELLTKEPAAARQTGDLDAIQSALDAAATATAPWPGVNDATGLAADGLAAVRDPSWTNLGLLGLSLIPGLPSVGGPLRAANDALGGGKKAKRPSRQKIFSGTSKVHDIVIPEWKVIGDQVSMPVMENPTRSEIAKELKRSGFLRVLKDHQTGDVFIWPGEEALHEDIIRQLGLSDMTENLGQILSLDDLKKFSK